ncbi:hypothetical protein [Micromonospora sp. NBC_01796]|uniref:hypothetical protein n=1 Tax=Micromonospora sp. NBC_01796 TaxID=2975987 RepID=UPI002DDC2185|nr:hypothetical protein [Micromonospora sp. NBC_01796]WSA88954.1 hypothetical protein OIE47_15820 [Micromonospora sp. NBC_01796]
MPALPRVSTPVALAVWVAAAALSYLVVCQPFDPAPPPAACGLVPGGLLVQLVPDPDTEAVPGEDQSRLTGCVWNSGTDGAPNDGNLRISVERFGPSSFRTPSTEAQDAFGGRKRFHSQGTDRVVDVTGLGRYAYAVLPDRRDDPDDVEVQVLAVQDGDMVEVTYHVKPSTEPLALAAAVTAARTVLAQL